MSAKRRIRSANVPEPAPGTFSQALAVGETIYIAGQTPTDAAGNVIGVGDLRAQTQAVFERIAALLAAADATMDDIVKLTIFTTDIAQRALISEVRKTFFTGDFPASTLVEVAALAHPAWLVEIEAIAVPFKNRN